MKKHFKITFIFNLLLISLLTISCNSVQSRKGAYKTTPIINNIGYVNSEDSGPSRASRNVNTVRNLQNTTVFIVTNVDGKTHSATGVIAKRNGRAYVWTVAHTFEAERKLIISPEELKRKIDNGEKIEMPPRKVGKIGDAAFVTMAYREDNKIITLVMRATVIAISPSHEHDLAILELSMPSRLVPLNEVKWYDDRISAGQDVYHIGNMKGIYSWSASKGIVSYDFRRVRNNTFFQTDHMAVPGSSGGGVFLQNNEECLGLITWISEPGINFAIPFYRVREFAKENGYEWIFDHKLSLPKKLPESHPKIPHDEENEKEVEEALKRFKNFKVR